MQEQEQQTGFGLRVSLFSLCAFAWNQGGVLGCSFGAVNFARVSFLQLLMCCVVVVRIAPVHVRIKWCTCSI
jgi:hypothetical protein